jgi:hypothetical protein
MSPPEFTDEQQQDERPPVIVGSVFPLDSPHHGCRGGVQSEQLLKQSRDWRQFMADARVDAVLERAHRLVNSGKLHEAVAEGMHYLGLITVDRNSIATHGELVVTGTAFATSRKRAKLHTWLDDLKRLGSPG